MTDASVVAILGVSQLACALARVSAASGCVVRIFDPEPNALERAQEAIRVAVEVEVAAGRLPPEGRQRTLDNISCTPDLEEAVTHADLLIELSSPSERDLRILLMKIGDACRASAVVAARSARPDELIDYIPQPGRLVGLLCEGNAESISLGVVPTVETSRDALDLVLRFAERVNHSSFPRQRRDESAARG